MKSVDERTKLAGTNKLELLLFMLGTDAGSGREECFGINVFKVREVRKKSEITRAPEMPNAVEGMVSLRGALVPVIDIASYIGLKVAEKPETMIVTEYNGNVQGFLVHAVDTILRLNWSDVKVPPDMLVSKHGGLVTAVTELPDNRLVMLLDVEKILAETSGSDHDAVAFAAIKRLPEAESKTVFFADDSVVARNQIARTLEKMGVRGLSAINGAVAWQNLQQLADQAQRDGVALSTRVNLILTDVEMPEMDGYLLTKNIKSDPRFNGIPVLMHSSLSGTSNQTLGKSVGVDEYVAKFEPERLSSTLARLLEGAKHE